MGSIAYPDENYFESLVQTEGNGYTNAYTSDEITDYYFSTRSRFKFIMKVFAQFFSNPLLAPNAIRRWVGPGYQIWVLCRIVLGSFLDSCSSFYNRRGNFKRHNIFWQISFPNLLLKLNCSIIFREVSAVNSEWQLDLNSDVWTSWDLMRELSNPKHPFHT